MSAPPVGQLLLVGLGGALGSVARFWLGSTVQGLTGGLFPWGTLAVNAVGSFFIALVVHAGASRGLLSPEARLFLTTGVMGGFTTYSAFNHETMGLFARGVTLLAVVNVGATVLGCLAAGAAGLLTARWLFGY